MKVAALYGGSEDRHVAAPLTVSTTHQLYRFANAFDTIIIDEVDAFPYSMDTSLQQAVQKAKKQTSATIYLTATPSRKMQQELSKRDTSSGDDPSTLPPKADSCTFDEMERQLAKAVSEKANSATNPILGS